MQEPQEAQEPARSPARNGRTAQLVILAVLLGVFGWRVRSCQAQVEAKRRAAEEHEARFLAQTAAEPSPLPLDPYVRRAAMADALRLRPDRRFLLASNQIQQLTGGSPVAAVARFEGGKWKLTAGAEQLGEVPELPDYPDLMRPLVAFAKRRLAASPLSGTDSPAADGPLQWEPEARETLPAELARWSGGQHTPATLHKAARAASSLCFYLVDLLETDDELAAKAIALVALDIAAGKAQTGSEEAVLASALGYVRASRALGARLQGESSLRFFLAGDDAHLRERAVLREAGAPDRYLRLRRALQRQDEDDANRFLDSYHGTERLELAVLALLLQEQHMENFAPVAFALPVLVLAAAEGVPVKVPPQDSQSDTVELSVEAAAVALHVDPETLSPRLEEALKRRDPDTRGYLKAAWLSALRRQGEFLADSQGNREAAARFVDRLAKDPAPTVQQFQRWFATRTTLSSGKVMEALSAAEKVEGVGGAAAFAILEEATSRSDFSDPRVLRAARAVVPRLDSRVAHRAMLGNIAWSTLQDLRVSERLLRSAFEADPDGHQYLREWFTSLSSDPRELERIGRDKFGLRRVRSSAWSHLWDLGGGHAAVAEQGFRSMLEEDPKDDSTAVDLARHLRLSGRLEDARAVLLVWLRTNDGPNVTAANVRATLARYSFIAGRYAEGLKMVGPALRVGNASSFRYAALNLAGAGRAVEARQMTETLLQRYQYPRSVALAAEVEWQLGDLDAAAQRLAARTIRLTATDYLNDVADGFVRIFGDRPDQAAAAVVAAAKAGVEHINLISLGGALEAQGHPEAAFRALEAIPAEGERAVAIHLTASRSLRKARGEEAARAWLKKTFPIVRDDRGRQLSFLAFREGMPELMWDAVPDPKGADEYAEGTWMLRAAQVALQGGAAPPARKQALREHYAAIQKPTRHTQIGRYLIGEVPEAELAKLVTDLPSTCEVPYYFGVRAQGEKRFADAADWYRVAVECGLHSEAEYIFANNELYRWRSHKNVFSRLR
jgi:hypothetical protein